MFKWFQFSFFCWTKWTSMEIQNSSHSKEKQFSLRSQFQLNSQSLLWSRSSLKILFISFLKYVLINFRTSFSNIIRSTSCCHSLLEIPRHKPILFRLLVAMAHLKFLNYFTHLVTTNTAAMARIKI